MPVHKEGKYWNIGSGKARYKSKADAEAAYRGYLWHKHKGGKKGGK